MEENEMEMSKEELRKWIREKVKKNTLISTAVLEKCNLLQSLLERKEKQAAHLMTLFESVAACEAIVKKQYSFLGWEYRETDSDDDDNITGHGNTPPSPCEFVHAQALCPSTTNGPTRLLPKLQDSENLNRDNGKNASVCLKKLVVVLTRLSTSKIKSLICPPTLQSENSDAQAEPEETPQNHCSEEEPSNNADSDMQVEPEEAPQDHYSKEESSNNADSYTQWEPEETPQNHCSEEETSNNSDAQWEPEDDSSDSDFSFSSHNTGSNKRRKIDRKNNKLAKRHATPQSSTNSNPKGNVTKTSTPQTNKNTNPKGNMTKTSTPQANAKNNVTKTSTLPTNTNGVTPVSTVSALSQSSDRATKVTPNVLLQEIRVNMNVLARKSSMSWKQGKVIEIVIKEDGRVKYKISFDEKGKSLVSGHHIAFDCLPKAEQLFVGARMVVKCPGDKPDKPKFCPCILAELPSRKNRMRFLVFVDDHRPFYVGLPLLHLVCRPLEEPLDDIQDDAHKNFLKEYIRSWPYPPQTQYKIGQIINAKLNGSQQRCEVLAVDCSLIQVAFEKDQHKEWIYRGSLRLEHMINMMENLEMKKD
ncbi:histone-lysine N-methyltransferase SETDB1-A [Micropterus dolomieu]|uniref:histone-lysine N-methyltransferase SETDB1-A n=1 Tax=Micropterus dolomieu TaxID=147949 RepID=UPI001E8D35F9|nr:histone-lysine N-methyltransferase SETDB1-A [Micropterus dolomieu]XP_045913703.1 histone-lysine N-methyltransferase SETDB1-A [Micropterus dolomieu]XP_045913704.1 histone-lysine N-methyltransferase SETDB1-A [Micropterus dolomieu]